ncbi:MAG: hypothetical protein VX733_09760 [Candidatus Latescibacterota bacterium]|nr:hypothetical protein [Candidatus Latescibacterota bacterium]
MTALVRIVNALHRDTKITVGLWLSRKQDGLEDYILARCCSR